MYIGRVSGTVVATIKNELYQGRKLLVVDRLNLQGKPTGRYDIAVDMVQAGAGDLVLVLDEGNSARQIVGREPGGAIRAVIVGIIDRVDIPGSTFEPYEPPRRPEAGDGRDG
ncbi:MAG TPA: EutN/CcmL family microcompartment protein [Anaerolineae bacterium]|nr:EutN/CcmL family microcompartment protein [Anaerolineae bacterium]